jgi:hypothetical protein
VPDGIRQVTAVNTSNLGDAALLTVFGGQFGFFTAHNSHHWQEAAQLQCKHQTRPTRQPECSASQDRAMVTLRFWQAEMPMNSRFSGTFPDVAA